MFAVFTYPIYIYIYDNQIVHHNPCFIIILGNNSFDNQGSEINKNIFLHFDILPFTKTFFLLICICVYTYI